MFVVGWRRRVCKQVALPALAEGQFDSPLGTSTGAAALFAASGGVMEAAVRTLYHMLTGQELDTLELQAVRGLQGIKEATLQVPWNGRTHDVRVAVASGIANATHLLERMNKREVSYDFVEVMACPGGCIGGGGQPKSDDPLILMKRVQGIYALDKQAATRQSHLNPKARYVRSATLLIDSPCADQTAVPDSVGRSTGVRRES